MNRTIATIAAAAAAGSAWADDITIDPNPFVSTRSRAEVMAEQQQFQAAGVNPWADEYDQLRGFQSTMSRAEVTAAYLAARGEVAAMDGEDSGSAYLMARSRRVAGPVLAALPADAE